jgi:hypothetical protein
LNVLDFLRSAVFVLCELFVLFLVFSPLLLTRGDSGATRLRPFGPRWMLTCVVFLAALFAPV